MRSLKLQKAFTLLEILVVVIIIGILAALGFPNFAKTKESTLDKEAQANLKLISVAEKIYHLENAVYYISADRTAINNGLKLSLPAQNWNYKIDGGFTAKAQRAGDNARAWCITQATDEPYSAGCSW